VRLCSQENISSKVGETLCNVIQRAGCFTDDAYLLGAIFIRQSVQKKQQKALDRIQENLDDLLVQIHLSPSKDNAEKMPASEQKHNIMKVIKQLKKAKAIGRMVIDLEGVRNCEEASDFILEDGDKLFVPKFSNEVSVMGEVYFPTSHFYMENWGIKDYIKLSGGSTVLARKHHAYVVHANGEVMSARSRRWFNASKNIKVTPGSAIYVPINVDRINRLETSQSWSEIVYHLAVSAASLSVLGVF